MKDLFKAIGGLLCIVFFPIALVGYVLYLIATDKSR